MKNLSKKSFIARFLLIVSIILLYVLMEVFWHIATLVDENTKDQAMLSINDSLGWVRLLCKTGIGISSILIFLPTFLKKKKDSYAITIMIILFLFMLADMLINYVFVLGAILFALGHLILTIYFYICHKPKKENIIVFSIAEALGVIVSIIGIAVLKKTLVGLLIMVYSLFICSLLSSCIKEKRSIIIAISFFVLSDVLLMINLLIDSNIIVGHFLRFFYYLSIILLALTDKKKMKEGSISQKNGQ